MVETKLTIGVEVIGAQKLPDVIRSLDAIDRRGKLSADALGAIEQVKSPLTAAMPPEMKAPRALSAALGTTGVQFADFDKVMRQLKIPMVNYASLTEKTTGMMHRQVFAWLGIMFAGMALSRAFKGLLQPAEDMSGALEIISMVLAIVFLPIMLWLIDSVILPLADVFLSLDDSTQMIVGAFVLLMSALGTVMMVLGQWQLFLGAIGMLFGGLGNLVIGGLSGLFNLLVTAITGLGTVVLVAVAAAFAAVYLAFDQALKAAATTLAGILGIVGGVILFLKGIWEVVNGILTLDFGRVVTGLKMMVDGLVQVLTGAIQILWGLIVEGLLGITLNAIPKALQIIMDFFSGLVLWILEKFDNLFGTQLASKWLGFVNGMRIAMDNLWKGMASTVDNFFRGILTWVDQIKSGLANIGGGGVGGGGSSGGGRWIPWFQEGGYVANDTLGYLHAGEYVVPKSGMLVGGSSGGDTNTMNVYIGSVSKAGDEAELLEKIKQLWSSELRRLGVS